mmetsp:Transcript_8796/g.15957  ORF Transcript_8796/g.15957 Transcript_8796/m.15957 type:complete len:475 (-) Transcript_8796:49-1473(-)
MRQNKKENGEIMEEVEWCILEERIKSLTEKEKLEGAIRLQTLAWEMMDDRRVRLTILLQFLARSLISSQNAKQYTAALRIQIWAMKRLGGKCPIDDPIILDHVSSYLSYDSGDDSDDSDENDDRDEDTISFALPRKKRLDVIWEEEYEDDEAHETDKKDSQQLEDSPRSVVVTCLKSASLVSSSSSSLLDLPMLLPFHKKGTSHHVDDDDDDDDDDETTQSSHTSAFRQNNNIHSIMSTTRKKKKNTQTHGSSNSVVACRSCTLGGGAFQKTNDNTNYNSSSRRTTNMEQSPFIAVHKQFTGSMMMAGLSSPKTRQRNKKVAYIQVPLIEWFSQFKEMRRSRFFVSMKSVLFASLAILIYLNHATTTRGTGMVHNTDYHNCLLIPPSEIKKHSSHYHYTESESSSGSNSSFIQNMSQCFSLQRLGPFSKQPRNEAESSKRGRIESSISSSHHHRHHHARYQTLKHLVESILDDL